MKAAVLCVDDDAGILEGYRRVLGRQFEVYLACGPYQGIEKLEGGPDYAVVIADMRMPEMTGVEFLRRSRQRSPETKRIMLSGDAEQATALQAVNEGQVSAFLTKPCPAPVLLQAVKDAAEAWQARRAERGSLEGLRQGSVRALLELLRAADPLLHARSLRVRDLCRRLLEARGLAMDWQLESCALLSQVGMLYLPEALRAKIEKGQTLGPAEESSLDSQGRLGASCVMRIPGFEGVAEGLQWQRRGFDGSGTPGQGLAGAALPLASRLLHLACDLDWFLGARRGAGETVARLRSRAGRYDAAWLELCVSEGLCRGRDAAVACSFSEVAPGMRVAEDLRDQDGTLLLGRGGILETDLAQALAGRAGRVNVISAFEPAA